jgi:hypothetical protein
MTMRALFALFALTFAASVPAVSQQMPMEPSLTDHWYSIIEIPALLAAVVFGFLTARALRGGRLGTGMQLIAWGFLVMAVGHMHMQGEAIFGFNLFSVIFGSAGGEVVWIAALLVTWTLTGLGFFRLYQASSKV